MDSTERKIFLVWLLVLCIGCALFWTTAERARERERLFVAQEAGRISRLVNEAVSSFFVGERDEAHSILRKEAKNAADLSAPDIPPQGSVFDEAAKVKITASLKANTRAEVGFFICDPDGRVVYSWSSPEELPVVRALSTVLNEKPDGVLKVLGSYFLYASVEREERKFCVFTPAALVTALVGESYRKNASDEAKRLLDVLSGADGTDGRCGVAYLKNGKLIGAEEDFPFDEGELNALPYGKPREKGDFFRTYYVVKAPLIPTLGLSGLFYVVQTPASSVLFILLASFFILAALFFPLSRFLSGGRRRKSEEAAAVLVETCASPRAVFDKRGVLLFSNHSFWESLKTAGFDDVPPQITEAARNLSAEGGEELSIDIESEDERTLSAHVLPAGNMALVCLSLPPGKRLETEYQIMIHHWSELISNFGAGLATFGEDATLKSYNRALLKMLGVSEEKADDFCGETVSELFELSPLKGPFGTLEDAVSNGRVLSAERLVFRTPEGAERTFFAWTAHLRKEGLTFSCLMLVELEPVSELEGEARRLRDELENTRRALSVVTHEIRNALQTFLHRALEERTDEDPRLVRRLKLLSALVNDILEFSRLDPKLITPNRVLFSPNDLALDLAQAFYDQAKAKGLEFRLDLSPALPEKVTGDPSRISEILINIVSNALKYVDSGTITLEVDYSKPNLIFRVKDTGIGLHPKQQEKLFDEFYRASDPNLSATRGTGIGLAITRKLIELLGGKIALTSSPGKGTTFTISVPVEESAPAAVSEDARKISSLASRIRSLDHKPRLLVVDDDPASLSYYRVALKKAGADFEMAPSAEAALDWLTSEQFDVLITDDQMPGVTGTELAEALREMKGDRILIVLLTGLSKEEISKPELFDAIITKPVDMSFWKVFSPADEALFPVKESADACPIDDHFLNFLDDPELLELLSDYLKVLGDTAERLFALLREGKREELLDELHSIKGTAASYGLADISALARKAEAALRNGVDDDEIRPFFEAFTSEYKRITRWLEGYIRAKESSAGGGD